MAKTILNFHFDYWNPSLSDSSREVLNEMRVMADFLPHDWGFVCVENLTNQLFLGVLLIIFVRLISIRTYRDLLNGAHNNLVWSSHRLKMFYSAMLKMTFNVSKLKTEN